MKKSFRKLGGLKVLQSVKFNFPTMFVLLFAILCFLVSRTALSSETRSIQVLQRVNEGSKVARLEYRISFSEKDSFFLYEPISVRVCVKNISDETVRVFFSGIEGLVIQDQNGNNYPLPYSMTFEPPEIKPRDSVEMPVNLTNNFGIPLTGGPDLYWGFPRGEYKVYYRPTSKDSTLPFTFHVVEPSDDESEALKLYLEAGSLVGWNSFATATPSEKNELLKQEVEKLLYVANRYPKSVYAVQALYRAVDRAWHQPISDKELAYQITQKLLGEYPETGARFFIFLRAYHKAQGNVFGYREELERIIRLNMHPNLTKAAEGELKKLNSEKQ